MIDYARKRVIVTGAASGMGEAASRLCGELGAEVHAFDIRPIGAPVATCYTVDLAKRASIDAALERVGAPVHALFNCAGVPGPPLSPLETMLVNFVGPRHLTESVVERMPPGGAVASVASLAGMGFMGRLSLILELCATADFEAACAWCEAHPDAVDGYKLSKECIVAYTLLRAKDLGRRGVRINCTSPGITETAMLPHFHAMVGKEWMERHLQGFLGRNARAEEQAWPLLFLNSDLASYVTGANLFVDAGYSGALMTGQVAPPPPPEIRS